MLTACISDQFTTKLYLGAFSAYSVRIQDKVCKLFCPVAHIQAPVLPLWILVLEVLQLLYNPNIADKLLNYLKRQWDSCAGLCRQYVSIMLGAA